MTEINLFTPSEPCRFPIKTRDVVRREAREKRDSRTRKHNRILGILFAVFETALAAYSVPLMDGEITMLVFVLLMDIPLLRGKIEFFG